jgi:hypothetical protein
VHEEVARGDAQRDVRRHGPERQLRRLLERVEVAHGVLEVGDRGQVGGDVVVTEHVGGRLA